MMKLWKDGVGGGYHMQIGCLSHFVSWKMLLLVWMAAAQHTAPAAHQAPLPP